MKKKWLFLLVALVAVIIFTVSVVWFNFTKPEAFPSREKLIAEINGLYPDAAANVIQDTIFLDERHVFVPFISNDGQYSSSYWTSKKKGWEVVYIHSSDQPRIWKIDKNDPSTYYIVWNFFPEEKLKLTRYYLIRNREYSVIDGIENYNPRVQMQIEISLEDNQYGALQLPKDWVTFIDPLMKMEKVKQPDPLSYFVLEQYLYFGWRTFDENGQPVMPIGPKHNWGFSRGNAVIDYMMIINEEQLEFLE